MKPKDKQFTYELVLISPEYYTNNQISIDHAATKKVEVIINDILTKHTNTIKKYRAEATKSIQHIVFPGMSLRDAIKYCTFRAQSANYPDSLFKFYETASGFNFFSLGKMISNEPKLTINYFQQNIQTEDEINLAAFSAYNYTILTKNDTVRALINGGYKNTLLLFDPLLKKKEYKELDYFNDFDQLANVDKKKTSTNYFRDIAAIQGSIDYAIIGNLRKKPRATSIDNSDRYPEGYKGFFLNRQMSRARFNDLVIEINIPITHFIEAGDKIAFEVPNDSGAGQGSGEDEYVSGNYIVTSLKHVFSGEKGITSLICKKSGFQTDIKRKD